MDTQNQFTSRNAKKIKISIKNIIITLYNIPYDTYIPFYCNVLSSLVSHTGKGKNKIFIFKLSNFT